MTTYNLLKLKGKLPFKYEEKSPYARPRIPGIRHAVTMARARGMRVFYSVKVEKGFFVYYVNAK